MIRALAAAAFALLFLSNAAHAQEAGCAKDTDCKGSRICVDHACVDAPVVKSCARDLDCPGDDICEQHLCLPPANATAPKKTKGKPSRRERDLIKEAEIKAAREAAAKTAQEPPPAPAPVVTPAPVQAAPAPAPAPVAVPPPTPPPSLITETKPAETPAPAPAPAQTQPPAPPPDLITAPPPPLVAAAAPPPPPADSSSDFSPGFVYGIGLTAGIHVWSAGASETDFGLDLNGDLGVRIFRNFGVEVLAQGSWTPMLASRTGLLASIGLGVRLENLGPVPGHFLLGGAGSFAAISADSVDTINVSGGSVLLQYGVPLFGDLEGRGQMGLHFLSDGNGGSLTLFTLTAGVAFGN